MIDTDYSFVNDDFKTKITATDLIDDNRKNEYLNKVDSLTGTVFNEAFNNIKNGLNNLEIKSDNDVILPEYEDGKDYYAEKIYEDTGFTSMKDYKAYLDSKLDIDNMSGSIVTEFQKTYFNYIQNGGDENLDFTDVKFTEANSPNEVLKKLETDIKADFPEINDTDFNMEILPSALKPLFNGVAAFYLISSIDNTSAAEKMMLINDYTQSDYSTIAHEGYPGHMYQSIYYKSVEHPVIRDVLSYYGYSEGYANYVQRYASKYADNKEAAAVYEANQSISYYAILQIDYELNYEGDTKEAKEMIASLFGSDEEMINEIYSQLRFSPESFVPYYVGGSLIDDLKEEVLDNNSDLSDKDFHEALLNVGPAPYEIYAKWVKQALN